MSDSFNDPPPFRIRQVGEDEPWGAGRNREAAPHGARASSGIRRASPVELPGLATEVTGAVFGSASSTLAFLAAMCGSGVAREAAIRRSPEGSWWAEAPAAPERAAGMALVAGGRPYAPQGNRWVPVSSLGRPVSAAGNSPEVGSWPRVELRALLAALRPRGGRYAGAAELQVALPAALARWVLRRASAPGVEITLQPVMREPLGGGTEEAGWLLLSLRASGDRPLSPSLVASLTALPYTLVCHPIPGAESVWLDARVSASLPPALVTGAVPAGEVWALGPPETGHWRLRTVGEAVEGASLLLPPAAPDHATLPPLPTAAPVTPVTVRLVPRPGRSQPVDAVLLDDAELGWLRPMLAGRPAAETAFLVPGPGVHLLTAPGGLAESLPFGIPVTRVGPGSLYVQLGRELYPPLPEAARRSHFGLDRQLAVVVTEGGTYGFSPENMVPAWSLWLGEPARIQADLSPGGRAILERLSAVLSREEARAMTPPPPGEKAPLPRERSQLLERAQQAELAGNLVEAAELLERAGLHGPAGRLYERAARGG